MNTYTQIIYHIIFGTKYGFPTLEKSGRNKLFKYIWGLLKNKKCHLYRINGVENHLHILTHLHPTIPLSSLVKDIKLASSSFIKQENLFPKFNGWQKGYGAFTHHHNDKRRLIEYIKKQETHHKCVSWKDEFLSLLNEHDIEFEEKYLFWILKWLDPCRDLHYLPIYIPHCMWSYLFWTPPGSLKNPKIIVSHQIKFLTIPLKVWFLPKNSV